MQGKSTNLELLLKGEKAGRPTRNLGNILIRIIPVHDLIFIIIFKRIVVLLGIIWTFGMS